jgi:hypothetical protein
LRRRIEFCVFRAGRGRRIVAVIETIDRGESGAIFYYFIHLLLSIGVNGADYSETFSRLGISLLGAPRAHIKTGVLAKALAILGAPCRLHLAVMDAILALAAAIGTARRRIEGDAALPQGHAQSSHASG